MAVFVFFKTFVMTVIIGSNTFIQVLTINQLEIKHTLF